MSTDAIMKMVNSTLTSSEKPMQPRPVSVKSSTVSSPLMSPVAKGWSDMCRSPLYMSLCRRSDSTSA